MEYFVAKPFQTPSRRFGVGDRVTAWDIDGPVSAETWAAGGFLSVPAVDPPVMVQKPSKKAAPEV